MVEEATWAIMYLQPAQISHALSRIWTASPYEWRRARAVCVYSRNKDKFAWYTVDRTLCQMKAESPPFVCIPVDTFPFFRFSQSRFSRATERSSEMECEVLEEYEQ
jgi:hypothetical protein